MYEIKKVKYVRLFLSGTEVTGIEFSVPRYSWAVQNCAESVFSVSHDWERATVEFSLGRCPQSDCLPDSSLWIVPGVVCFSETASLSHLIRERLVAWETLLYFINVVFDSC